MLTLLLLLTTLTGLPEPHVAPLEVTPEMRVWVARRLPRDRSPAYRWQRLGHALVHPQGFDDSPLETATAAEAFRRRRGNCVAYAHLLVALGREAGLDVFFVVVDEDAPTLERGSLRVVQKHMAAALETGGEVLVLDLGGLRRDDGRAHRISDRTARAIFFSNLGAERLLAGAPEDACRFLRAAVEQDPELVHAWTNLGVAERRAGRLPPDPVKRGWRTWPATP